MYLTWTNIPIFRAIEHHEQWTPPTPNRTLYFVWDFIQRTKYMMAEVDNIQVSETHPILYTGEEYYESVGDICRWDRVILAVPI